MDVHLRCWEKVISFVHNSSFRWSYSLLLFCVSRELVFHGLYMREISLFLGRRWSERSIFDKVQVDEDINKSIEAYKSISNNSRD